VEFFDGDKEGVHIHVENGAGKSGSGRDRGHAQRILAALADISRGALPGDSGSARPIMSCDIVPRLVSSPSLGVHLYSCIRAQERPNGERAFSSGRCQPVFN
jgi:hypothetical protein